MACQKSAPTMLRHHSFAKSLVQEKERDLKEEGRTDAYNYHILQSDTHTCLIRKSRCICIQNRHKSPTCGDFRWLFFPKLYDGIKTGGILEKMALIIRNVDYFWKWAKATLHMGRLEHFLLLWSSRTIIVQGEASQEDDTKMRCKA